MLLAAEKRQRCYGRIIQDLFFYFMMHPFLSFMQWMNPYHPAKYVDFEENTEWTLGIQLEMHIMAIIFLLISGCYSIRRPDLEDPTETSRKTLLSAANCTLKRLREYLNEESTLKFLSSTAHSAPVSLHVPLHRTLSVVLAKLVLFPWKDVNDGFLSSLNLNYSEQEVLALMEHPLRIVVWTAQIRANRWTDVSGELNRLELIYRGSFWHDHLGQWIWISCCCNSVLWLVKTWSVLHLCVWPSALSLRS